MGVGEAVGREGVGGGVSEWIRVWKCVEKSKTEPAVVARVRRSDKVPRRCIEGSASRA
jgi:hypothetical protein